MCRLSWNLGTSTSWNPQGLSRPVMGLLYVVSSVRHSSNWHSDFVINYWWINRQTQHFCVCVCVCVRERDKMLVLAREFRVFLCHSFSWLEKHRRLATSPEVSLCLQNSRSEPVVCLSHFAQIRDVSVWTSLMPCKVTNFSFIKPTYTHLSYATIVTRLLTTGIPSAKCVVRRFHGCANVIECTYTNLDSTI